MADPKLIDAKPGDDVKIGAEEWAKNADGELEYSIVQAPVQKFNRDRLADLRAHHEDRIAHSTAEIAKIDAHLAKCDELGIVE